jgi:alanine dehydrogenase
MEVLVLSSRDIERVLDLDQLRETMRQVLQDLSNGNVLNRPRHVEAIPNGALGYMTAASSARGLLGYKAVAVLPHNTAVGLNPHQGLVTLLDFHTGQLRGLVEASMLTATRTAAVSSAATQNLARSNSQFLGLIGAGRQAYEHARALHRIFKLKQVFIYNRTRDTAMALSAQLKDHFGLECEVLNSPVDVAQSADILVLATSSEASYLDVDQLRPGTHVNAIGACRPHMAELNFQTEAQLLSLSVFVDSLAACQTESRELRQFIEEPHRPHNADEKPATRFSIHEIGGAFLGRVPGRESESQITVFKSVGLGAEDLYAADLFLTQARQAHIGQSLNFTGET